nr:DUF1707 domain-containing protein [Micromonospora sp. DSM 115978]
MNPPDWRASDDDRAQVVHALERHTAAGRLDLDEYADRVDRALAARTHGELAAVVHDLPAEVSGPAPGRAGESAQLATAFLIAMVALVIVGGLVLLLR